MKQRGPVAVAVLSVVTLGIYFLYWLYDLVQTINPQIDQEQRVWGVRWLVAPLLLMVGTFLISIPVAWLDFSYKPFTIMFSAFLVLVVIVGFLGMVVIPFVWFYKLSHALEAYSEEEIDSGQNYIIFLVLYIVGLPMIWQGITQDELNKLAANKAADQPNQQAGSEPSSE